MRTIPLTKGKEALVDDEDYDYLTRWKWCFWRGGPRRTGYAVRLECVDGKSKFIHMHRVVAERHGLKLDGLQVDHIDRSGLNNQQANLRVATRSQNNANAGLRKDNTSGFKGVFWHRHTRTWQAQIRVSGRHISLGRFDDPREAARAYNDAAVKHFGEFSCLNPL